ncbi:MAG TPA: helix-turn-helix transcriptional regulator [Chitinophagaceae bacterium]|nr:helix-turn-helix transcriptional regulator [Chitinophagaceae bacterium]
MKTVLCINEQTKTILDELNDVDLVSYVELKNWYANNAFTTLSIRYVLEGSAYFMVDGVGHSIQSNHFIVAAKQPAVECTIKGNDVTKSLWINISGASLSDAYQAFKAEARNEINEFSTAHFDYPYFLDSVYHGNQNLLGQKLFSLSESLRRSVPKHSIVDDDWFFDVVMLVIRYQFRHFQWLSNLQALKASTRKEILRRLLYGKSFIDECFLTNPDIKSVARLSNMSEFHFFRSFKQAFGCSPYQYLLTKRLDYARKFLQKKEAPVSEIANQCGFPDIFTFSKAFKRKFGHSPSKTATIHA